MKTYLVLILFLFGATLSAFSQSEAQTKYQFMMIEYDCRHKNEFTITIDGADILEESVEDGTIRKILNSAKPILGKIKEYQDKGWELVNMDIKFVDDLYINKFYYAYLKRPL